MFAPSTQPQTQKQSEGVVSSTEEDALKWNTDCVYFLASPLTCKKGGECEYRHSEYARMNPRDCYYWLNGNCMNPKCGFRHPPLEGLLGNQGGAASQQPPSQASAHSGVKQPVPCVFFQKGMCAKGDMCSFMHTPSPNANPNPAGFKKPLLVEAKPVTVSDPQFSKKPVENYSVEKKLPDVEVSATSRVVERYVPKHVGYEPPVVQKKVVPLTDREVFFKKYGSGDNNGKDADDVLRESSPGFDVLVDNDGRDSEYYHAEEQYGRRSQEERNSVNEYDPDFSAIADRHGETFRDQRFEQREERHPWGDRRRVSSERGDRLERRVYAEDDRSENILASDLRNRLVKQRRVNGMRSVGSHDYVPHDSSLERGYRESRRDIQRESSSRLQGRLKLRERSNGDEAHHFDRRSERGRDRSDISQGRLRDRIKGRIDEDLRDNQERDHRAPWVRRREMEDERIAAPRSSSETRSRREESKTEQTLGKRKSSEEEDRHRHRRSGDSFVAPLPLSEILKRKRAAASGGNSSNKTDEAGDETKLVTEEKTEAVSEAKPEEEMIMAEDEVIGEEGEQVYEGEEQAYEGDENGEYYYEEGEGYEENGEYTYEEGEEVAYEAEEGEGEAIEAEGEEDTENTTTVELLS